MFAKSSLCHGQGRGGRGGIGIDVGELPIGNKHQEESVGDYVSLK